MNVNEFGLDPDTVSGFLDEAGKHITTLNERLLAVEQGQIGAEAIAEMFRAAHSLKGAAGFLKLTDIATVTHRMESVLDQIRHGKMAFSNAAVDALFQSFDTVSSLLAGVAGGGASHVDTKPVLALLEAVLTGVTLTPLAVAKPTEAPSHAVVSHSEATHSELIQSEIANADDPVEKHLGALPGWLRGLLDEEDACEALVAMADGAQVVALRWDVADFLQFSRGAKAAMETLEKTVHVRRVLHLVSGPEELWAPLREYRLSIGVFAFCPGDPAALLSALAIPAGEAWIIAPGGGAPAHLHIGRDPATAATRHERLVVKSDMGDHRALWNSTTREALAELDAALLDLEREPLDTSHIDRVFRHLHSIKGASASMGLDEMARLAHQGENLLGAVRDGHLRLDAATVAGLFATKDILQSCIDRVERGEEESPDSRDLDAAFARFLNPDTLRTSMLPTWSASDAELASARATAGNRPLWKLRVVLTPQAPLPDLRYGMILSNLGRVATVHTSRPTLSQLEAGLEDPPPLCVLCSSSVPLRELIEAITCDHIQDWAIDPVAGSEDRAATPVAGVEVRGNTGTGAASVDTVRVDTTRLDHLLNTAGELVITKARLTQQVDTLVRLLDGVDLRVLEGIIGNAGTGVTASRLLAGIGGLRRAQDEVRRTRDTIMDLHRHTSAMQNSVMQSRMVPIGPLFQRFHRLVRDLCKERGKETKLVTFGDATELDKKLIDEIGDPLTHLIRNSVDHGMESPDERVAAGKTRQGTVRLEAFHQGSMICIQVSDDGRGLAVERIRSKAIERGLVTAEAAARLSAAEIYQFIFLPGFSTAAQVTNISGRGVGMDIVKSKVTALKGKIDITSDPGKGATFTISLPLTLAMIESLLVRIGEGRFAFPLDSVREIVEVTAQEVRSIEGKGRVIFLREQVISLLDLHRVLGINPLTNSGDLVRAVITKGGGETLAIAVDQVIGDEEIVVKPLGQDFTHVRGVSGATVLGDGGVALILDIHGIHELTRSKRVVQLHAGALT